MSSALIVLLALQWTVAVTPQSLQGAFGKDPICNGTFAEANATGIYAYQPDVNQGSQTAQPNNTSGRSLPLDLAVTLTEDRNTSRLFLSTWLEVNGADYSDDFSLGYDVCGMALSLIPENTIRRGQSDNGSCYEMFDETCVNDVTSAAEDYALQLTLNPTVGSTSNLTVDSIYQVCPDIAQMLNDNPPKSCSKYWQQNTTWIVPTALTGYNASILYGDSGCVTNATNNINYYSIMSNSQDYSDVNYDAAITGVTPIALIWMPIANAARPSTITYSVSQMRCGRPLNITEGSRKTVALPEATPVGNDGGGVSGGAIAGIVIGVLAAVALVAGFATWFFLRKRKSRNAVAEQSLNNEKAGYDAVPMYGGDGVEPQSASTEAPDTAISELPEDWRRPELDGGKDVTRFELPPDAGVKPVELEGTIPSK